LAGFRRLAGEYKLIILEGAGRAVELNLRKNAPARVIFKRTAKMFYSH
jgi:cobyric acid synthase